MTDQQNQSLLKIDSTKSFASLYREGEFSEMYENLAPDFQAKTSKVVDNLWYVVFKADEHSKAVIKNADNTCTELLKIIQNLETQSRVDQGIIAKLSDEVKATRELLQTRNESHKTSLLGYQDTLSRKIASLEGERERNTYLYNKLQQHECKIQELKQEILVLEKQPLWRIILKRIYRFCTELPSSPFTHLY